MENGGTGLVSVIFHRAVFLIFMLCLVPELLRRRLHKTEAVHYLEKKLEKLRLRARQPGSLTGNMPSVNINCGGKNSSLRELKRRKLWQRISTGQYSEPA